MKRFIFLLTIVFLLGMANLASAYDIYWRGIGYPGDVPPVAPSEDEYWSNINNWVSWAPPDWTATSRMPTSVDVVKLNRGGFLTLVDSGTTAVAADVHVSMWNAWPQTPGNPMLSVTGGALEVSGTLSVGTAGAGEVGEMNISGGTVTVGGPFVISGVDWGSSADGIVDMSGGTVNVGGYLEIGLNAGTGAMTLSGGTITAAGLSMAANGSLLITGGGMLVLPGNKEALIDGYISSGWLSPCVAEWHILGPYAGKTTVVALPTEVAVDIKPQSCPNPLNSISKGVTPVAILGSAELDVSMIDAASISLEGVAPIRSALEDVAAPVVDGSECDCTEAGPDGFTDLKLKFKTQDIVEALGEFANGETLVLTLTGELLDKTPIVGTDCIRVKIPRAKRPKKVK